MTEKYYIELGKLVINAGLLESSIRTTLLVLSKEYKEFAKILILPNFTTSQKLELMDRLVHFSVREEFISDWKNLIIDLRDLFTLRNTIFLSMPGMDKQKFIVCSVKKGKKGEKDIWRESAVNLSDLQKLNKKFI